MSSGPVVLGRLSGLFGVRGALKVFSHTEPREAIGEHTQWLVGRKGQWRPYQQVDCRRHGRTVIAQLEGVDDRDQAALLLGADVGVPRDALAPLAAGQYYWVDLVGLDVLTTRDVVLGRVERLFATGANDVLVVAGSGRERWLPFVVDRVIRDVNLSAGTIEVDWDPDW